MFAVFEAYGEFCAFFGESYSFFPRKFLSRVDADDVVFGEGSRSLHDLN